MLKCSYVDAIEIQPELFKCLIKTVELNGLSEIVHTYEGDINKFKSNSQYDLIVCNPPYRQSNRGRASKNKIKMCARFSNMLELKDVFNFAYKYLQNAGFLYLSYDVELSRKFRLELKRMMFLHHEVNKIAKLVFMEFRKDAGKELIVEPPFIQRNITFEKNN